MTPTQATPEKGIDSEAASRTATENGIDWEETARRALWRELTRHHIAVDEAIEPLTENVLVGDDFDVEEALTAIEELQHLLEEHIKPVIK